MAARPSRSSPADSSPVSSELARIVNRIRSLLKERGYSLRLAGRDLAPTLGIGPDAFRRYFGPGCGEFGRFPLPTLLELSRFLKVGYADLLGDPNEGAPGPPSGSRAGRSPHGSHSFSRAADSVMAHGRYDPEKSLLAHIPTLSAGDKATYRSRLIELEDTACSLRDSARSSDGEAYTHYCIMRTRIEILSADAMPNVMQQAGLWATSAADVAEAMGNPMLLLAALADRASIEYASANHFSNAHGLHSSIAGYRRAVRILYDAKATLDSRWFLRMGARLHLDLGRTLLEVGQSEEARTDIDAGVKHANDAALPHMSLVGQMYAGILSLHQECYCDGVQRLALAAKEFSDGARFDAPLQEIIARTWLAQALAKEGDPHGHDEFERARALCETHKFGHQSWRLEQLAKTDLEDGLDRWRHVTLARRSRR